MQEQQLDQPVPAKQNAVKVVWKGCLGAALAFLLLATGLILWMLLPVASTPPQYITEAEAEIQSSSPPTEVQTEIDGAKRAANANSSSRQYDIDQTMYALYSIEKY